MSTTDWDKVSLQKMMYDELDHFVPGQAGLQYYPVPEQEWKEWKKEQDRKAMEYYLKTVQEEKKEILDTNKKLENNGPKNKNKKKKIESTNSTRRSRSNNKS